jgi:hypothetical protein
VRKTKSHAKPALLLTFLERHRTEIYTLFFAALAIWVAASWLFTAQRVIRYYTPLPFQDYWRVVYDARFWRTLGPQIFLKPHNEHRIIFPELIEQLDLVLFRGRLLLPLIISFVCYFFLYVLVVIVVGRDKSLSLAQRAASLLLAGIVLGWQGSAVVLGDPFLLQWTLSSLCVLLSFWLLSRSFLVAALIAAVAATYSSGNCLLLWPILCWQSWQLRLKRRQLLFVALTGVVAIGFYFVDYPSASKLDFGELLRHPLHTLAFITIFMSMPLGLARSDAVAIAIGSINILLAGFLCLYTSRNRLWHSQALLFLFAGYAFTFLSALMVTAGRIDFSDGFGDAKANRFWVVQLIGWAELILLCLSITATSRMSSLWRATVFVVLFSFVGVRTLQMRSNLAFDDNQYANRQLAAIAFENGLQDTVFARRIFPSPALVLDLAAFLRENHLSVYSFSQFAFLGKGSQAAGQLTFDRHPGAITFTMPVLGGVEVVGWAEPDRDGSERIVFVNEKGNIVGFGGKPHAAFPSDLRTMTSPVRESWVGFVNLAYAAKAVSTFFLSRGRLHPIGSPVTMTSSVLRVRRQEGTLLPLEWQHDAAWHINGIPPDPYPDYLPQGPTLGTWTKAAGSTGHLTSSTFVAHKGGCLIIPIDHGPLVRGLSVQVVDAYDGRSLITLPLQNGDLGWQFWKINVDTEVEGLQISAAVDSSGWGEWLGIGQPSACDSFPR